MQESARRLRDTSPYKLSLPFRSFGRLFYLGSGKTIGLGYLGDPLLRLLVVVPTDDR